MSDLESDLLKEEGGRLVSLTIRIVHMIEHATDPNHKCATQALEVYEERRVRKLPERLKIIKKAREDLEFTYNLFVQDLLGDIKRAIDG